MCNKTCIDFGVKYLTALDIKNKNIIEVGSFNVNGSLRDHIISLGPKSYTGTDIYPGPGVDEICKVEDLIARYGENSFDVLISTELLEHVGNWRTAIINMKGVVKPGGKILITTRSQGTPYHGFPFDYWRFEISDMENIFADLEIEALIKDPIGPGVLMKARKPLAIIETDYRDIALYSIIAQKRMKNAPTLQIFIINLFNLLKPSLSKVMPNSVKNKLKHTLNKYLISR